jgi:methylthioribose-1-phosphate isomerase
MHQFQLFDGGYVADYKTIEWIDGKVRMIDQRLLPHKLVYVEYTDFHQVAEAIRTMVIRGAPAIGAAAGFGMALAALYSPAVEPQALRTELRKAAAVLEASRPTAHDLSWATTRLLTRTGDPGLADIAALKAAAVDEAQRIAQANININRQIGSNGLSLVPAKAEIIHHCNTGSLATVDYGTALGVVRTAHEHGKQVHVFVDETRPRLQGARLTAWELEQLGIPYTVIVDSASGYIMRNIGIDLCLVGCDRVAANGDTANKIGTYNLALVAHAHHVPFYVAGPTSTIDMDIRNGDAIEIEQRSADEVTHIGRVQITPDGAAVANPAFDVTPAQYITAIITERGIVWPPFSENLAQIMFGKV